MELKTNPILAVMLVVCTLVFTGCSDDSDEPKPEQLNVAENIIGNWLLASSTANEWATYEFSETSRINATTFENNKLQSGSGFYWIDEDKASVTGNFDYGNGQLPVYIDWVIEKVQPFQLTLKLFNDNQYLGNSSIYRILSVVMVKVNETSDLNYKSICGTDNVSGFNILDSSVASVSSTGEICGLKVGETYMTFKTEGGIAAIKVEVSPAPKTFAELVVGTWIYDKPSEKEWQNTTFVSDGYIDLKWTNPYSYNTIETASGYYTLTDKDCVFSVTTAYNMTINQKWVTEEINDLIWAYQCFNDNRFVGKYTGHRLLGTVTLKPGETSTPVYSDLTFDYVVVGYSSNDESIATVNTETGEITAVDYGRTYINVNTAKGAGYFEVNVEKSSITYDLSITYNKTVNTSAVTAELDKTYIPFTSQSTARFKSYADSDNREDAALGVTWNIPELTLTYVNLAK